MDSRQTSHHEIKAIKRFTVLPGRCHGRVRKDRPGGRINIKQQRHEKHNDYFNDVIDEFLE